MIRKFIEGHKYIYLGVANRENDDLPYGWNKNMNFVLLPQVLTCIKAYNTSAGFLEQPNRNSSRNIWTWDDKLDKWIDVTKMSEEEIQKILAEKRRRMVAERI